MASDSSSLLKSAVEGVREAPKALRESQKTMTVPGGTLDEVVAERGLKIGFIKIDVQGAEYFLNKAYEAYNSMMTGEDKSQYDANKNYIRNILRVENRVAMPPHRLKLGQDGATDLRIIQAL